MTPDLQTTWAQLLMRSLADAGVTNLVLSPGSRSTPFVLAAVAEARLRCIDAIDERTAAFFALGQAKATGRPTLLLCTSGSAGTHYFPAVIEAGYSHTPLLILTADRPLELQDSGAPQTIDQTRLFGTHVRGFVELGSPEGSELALRALRRQIAQAVALASWPLAGAVHLNARARKPLEPHEATSDLERSAAAIALELGRRPLPKIHLPVESPSPEGIARLASSIRRAKRGLIFCGPAPVHARDAQRGWLQLAARLGFPLLAEGPSQLRFLKGAKLPEGLVMCDGFGAFLGAPALLDPAAAPDLILQIGGTPTSSAWERYLTAHRACNRSIIAPRGWNDPLSSASESLVCEPGAAAKALAGEEKGGRGQWTELFAAANQAAWRAIDGAVEATDTLTEPAAVRATVRAVPDRGILAVGNSLPIRELDGFCGWESTACRVWSQRGANGINSLVSGAAGVGSTGEDVTLLLGDVSLLHDLGGLALARYAGSLTIVVLQNRGGRIFENLPIAGVPGFEGAAAHFTTPHAFELGPAAALYGLAYRRVEILSALEAALRPDTPRPLLVEVVVPPRSAIEIQAAVNSRVAAARVEEPPEGRPEADPMTPLMLLHGFGGSTESFDEVLTLAKARGLNTPILIEQIWGHRGQLETPGHTFEREVDRLAEAFEQRGGAGGCLMGYSLGARLALGILTHHPHLASRAILIGPHPGLSSSVGRTERNSADDAWTVILETKGIEAFVDAWESQPIFASQRLKDPARWQRQRAIRLSHPPRALSAAMRALGLARMPDTSELLSRLRTPILLVTGAEDPKFLALARAMQSTLPKARLQTIERSGHNPLFNQPEQMAALLAEELGDDPTIP